jgi:hypothetical protein
MTEPMPTTPKANYLHAAIAAAVGLYFIEVGAGLLPVTGDRQTCTVRCGFCFAPAELFSWRGAIAI